MSDAVFIRGLEFEANHGYTAQERRATRRFRVNLEIRRSLADAARSDKISDTVDYRKISEVAVGIGTRSTYRLLEAQLLAAPAERRHDLELVRNLVQGQTRRLARYKCENCGFRARQFYWQCPACLAWETYPPRRTEEFDLAPFDAVPMGGKLLD